MRWPTTGKASPGTAPSLTGEFAASEQTSVTICLRKPNGTAVTFTLQADGGTLEIGYQGQDVGDIRVLDDAVAVTQAEAGAVIVPCREGLLIPADSHGGFQQTFGTSDYEGCHMNMLGFLKSGSTLAVTWDDAYVWPEVQSSMVREADRRVHSAHHDRFLAATFGPDNSADTIGQRRLEHAGRRLPADRRAKGLGRHAAGPHPP